jgi:hypothetical protein
MIQEWDASQSERRSAREVCRRSARCLTAPPGTEHCPGEDGARIVLTTAEGRTLSIAYGEPAIAGQFYPNGGSVTHSRGPGRSLRMDDP